MGVCHANDAVCLLMRDIIDAFVSKKEYYLQFITTKLNNVEKAKVLEVIDGQQRLTTLTLLFSVLHNRIGRKADPISNGKLAYQVRETVTLFFDEYVYKDISPILQSNWDSFIHQYPHCDEQDIFYLYHAIHRINKSFDEETFTSIDEIINFETFLTNEVKIILNNVDGNISCEKVFSNLNDNKVDLTRVELIKGLFLTKAARDTGLNEKKSNKEIAEIRAVIGRQWDEISQWVNRREIGHFSFPPVTTDSANCYCYWVIKTGSSQRMETETSLIFFRQK